MAEAKKRNPDIKLYGLPWAYPGWVGNDPVTGTMNESATPFDHPEQTTRCHHFDVFLRHLDHFGPCLAKQSQPHTPPHVV